MPGLPVLYSFRRCPYAMRARLAIAASGQRCELREVVLRDKPQALIQASPKATVPVLVLADGTVLEQSLDIMLWALRLNDPDGWLTPERDGFQAMLAMVHECDEHFKPRLDRYKYPQRFAAERATSAGGGMQSMDEAGATKDGARNEGSRGPALSRTHNLDLDLWAAGNRDTAAAWLQGLEARLARGAYLFGERASLADMAIAPFVRQYAHVDREWFDAQPWPCLRAWLDAWMGSELLGRVMAKHRPWVPGASGELFP
ncbi:glutathione S-transferase [Pusillimonas noertemannii]|uniref:Glutathione S-transferase n=1 Tax=Pusillimonas noertemannii TaxID=305977 RepID=A0A2U1CR01_9BURK|nr:glutathione S-transferase [Pusillimonas noertemannii]NYT67557.1 glutathione S-transferase [Pusillimonas noertemannii]PVY68231.1 glutathione S-transferase [Pusillimonas noertemannii]TFL12275.1 glutathione S-transferase [Pusillimonas noertemannii]